jgi:hypothetical protein
MRGIAVIIHPKEMAICFLPLSGLRLGCRTPLSASANQMRGFQMREHHLIENSMWHLFQRAGLCHELMPRVIPAKVCHEFRM